MAYDRNEFLVSTVFFTNPIGKALRGRSHTLKAEKCSNSQRENQFSKDLPLTFANAPLGLRLEIEKLTRSTL